MAPLNSQQETDLIKRLDILLTQVSTVEWTEEEISNLANALKTFLKFSDLGNYVFDTLLFEAQKVVRSFNPFHDTYLKISKLLVAINNNELLNAFQTFLIKYHKPTYFLVLLQEMIKSNTNVDAAKKLFLSSLSSQTTEITQKYLETINQTPEDLTKELLSHSFHRPLRNYIGGSLDRQLKNTQIIPIILSNYQGNEADYFLLSETIIVIDEQYIDVLMNNNHTIGKCIDQFSNYILNREHINITIICSFGRYLEQHYPEKLSDFEDMFLSKCPAWLLTTYAIRFVGSNKRKVLSCLIEVSKVDFRQDYLMQFIKKFPQYQNLLPML